MLHAMGKLGTGFLKTGYGFLYKKKEKRGKRYPTGIVSSHLTAAAFSITDLRIFSGLPTCAGPVGRPAHRQNNTTTMV